MFPCKSVGEPSNLKQQTLSEIYRLRKGLPLFIMPRDRDPLVVGRVIGDVLDSFTKSINLNVSYNDRDISNGCELKPSQVVNQPRVDIGGDDLRAFHTLVRSFSK